MPKMLGKKPVRIDPRTLQLARYLTPQLPPLPSVVDNSKGVLLWGMLCNDRLGCCTISAVGHAVQAAVLSQVNRGIKAYPVMPSDDIIERYYTAWDGYDPSDPSTDQGGVELDVLNKWRQSDFAGYKLLTFTSVTPSDTFAVKQSISLFGGIYIGIELPVSVQGKNVWKVTNDGADSEPGSWGGHAVVLLDFDSRAKTYTCITWGQPLKMTEDFFTKYASEAYALISQDFRSDQGVNLVQLQQDLAAVTGAAPFIIR